MKTIIELFDSEQINNIALHMYFPMAKIVYIGSQSTMTKARRQSLCRFFEARGCEWTPEFIEVDRLDIAGIISAAETVLKAHADCCLDITGGSESALLAMGIIFDRYHISTFQVHPRSCALCQILGCESFDRPPCGTMTLSQITLLYGGCIVRSDDFELPTTMSLRQTVRELWSLCRDDRTFLNRAAAQLNLLAAYTNELYVDTCGSELTVTAAMRSVIQTLSDAGFLNLMSCGAEGIRLTYRSESVKRLLTKAGMTLEVLTRIAAEDAGVFTDVHQGVTLDWDGIIDLQGAADTRNELDVMLLRGMTPIFVSCKNGDVKKEALYELDVIAERFSGGYAKKVLVCSYLSGTPSANASLRRRAKDMGIRLIENVCDMTPEELTEKIAKLR